MNLQIDRIVKLKEVCRITGYQKSAIYKKMADGTFPQRLAVGANSVGWKLSTIQDWINRLPTK